jgi:hypothetical protein
VATLAPAAPRADPLAGLTLVLAGVMGVMQLVLPWLAIGGGLPGSFTGWQLFRAGRDQALDLSSTLATYAMPTVAVAGLAMALLGLAMFAPIDHRPLGLVGLLFALVATVAAGWWVLDTWDARGGIGQILDDALAGWYLFLTAGPVGVVGSVKALVTG